MHNWHQSGAVPFERSSFVRSCKCSALEVAVRIGDDKPGCRIALVGPRNLLSPDLRAGDVVRTNAES